jgi:hypothetical protein
VQYSPPTLGIDALPSSVAISSAKSAISTLLNQPFYFFTIVLAPSRRCLRGGRRHRGERLLDLAGFAECSRV